MPTFYNREGVPYRTSSPTEYTRLLMSREYSTTPPFDPSAHTVAEVNEYIKAHPDEAPAVLKREREGQNRTTVVG